jgi:hypothetical protein
MPTTIAPIAIGDSGYSYINGVPHRVEVASLHPDDLDTIAVKTSYYTAWIGRRNFAHRLEEHPTWIAGEAAFVKRYGKTRAQHEAERQAYLDRLYGRRCESEGE